MVNAITYSKAFEKQAKSGAKILENPMKNLLSCRKKFRYFVRVCVWCVFVCSIFCAPRLLCICEIRKTICLRH